MRLTKKIGAVALATVVATTTVMPAFAAPTTQSAEGANMTAGFVDHVGEVTLVGDFDITYNFKVTSTGTNNWDNFIVELHDDSKVQVDKGGEMVDSNIFLDLRADNFGWWYAAEEDATLVWDDIDEKTWDTYNSDMKKGVQCQVRVVRKGSEITATMKEGDTYSFKATATSKNFSKNATVYVTGENANVTDVTYVINSHVHQNSDIVVTKAPTCGAAGTAKCKLCGETNISVPATGNHKFDKVVKATTKANGSTGDCSVCGAKGGVTYAIKDATLSKTSYTYAAKSYKPSVTVKDTNGKVIPATYYTVSYKNNKSAGKATVTVKFKGIYEGTLTKTFTIKKASQKISKYVTSKRVKYLSVKKKSQTFKIGAKAKTSVKYSTVKKDSKKKVTVSKTGKVTVKKGTKKGTYSVKVKVSAKGNSNYKSASKTFTLKVKVR